MHNSYNIIWFMLGLLIVLAVSFDVFQAVIVPRMTSKRLRIAPFVLGQIAWPIHRQLSLLIKAELQNGFLDIFAPLGYVMLILIWIILLIFGYSLMLFSLGKYCSPPITDFIQAIYFAGSSILTLGFGDTVPVHWATKFIVLTAAVLGIIFLSLQVAYLFTLQTYLQMREQVVSTLTSRAGSPASGLVLLLRYKELNIVPSLSASFIVWENWVANILESHRAYALLLFFRSSSRTNSWVSSIGALCDAATLLSTTIESSLVGEAELFYWLAIKTLKLLCEYLEIEPDDHVLLTRKEFDEGVDLLKSAGYSTKDPELSWKRFALRRAGYMQYLTPMSQAAIVSTQVWIPQMSTK